MMFYTITSECIRVIEKQNPLGPPPKVKKWSKPTPKLEETEDSAAGNYREEEPEALTTFTSCIL